MVRYMTNLTYQIQEEYCPEKQYSIHVRKQIATCLSLFKKGEQIHVYEFARKHQNQLTKSDDLEVARNVVGKSVAIGKQLGLITKVESEHISFEDFLKFDTVSHLKNQLRKNRYKHKEVSRSEYSGTQQGYLYTLWRFHKWLVDREFSCTLIIPTGQFTFEKKPQTVKLEGLEHFFRLYETRPQNDPDFVRVIKKYLMDDIHEGKKWSTIDAYHSAILSYFKKNEFPIFFDWDPQTMFDDGQGDDISDEPLMSLHDLLEMLTTGKPSVTEKAVVLCKFHRGLDNSTFVDRFNYESWEQLIEYFGTDEYKKWNLEKCPVPVKLTRMKTGYTHRGFLDVDAIIALQKYLDYRQEKTNKPMSIGEPIFLNKFNRAIAEIWVQKLVPKLAKRASIQRVIKHYKKNIKVEKTSHELRDLLKSTLIASGTVNYVCELAIGHKVGDSYEKQDKLYPEKSRLEYAKASQTINIFSNISKYMSGDNEKDALRQEVVDLKQTLEKEKKSSTSELNSLREDQKKIMAWIARQEEKKINC